MTRRLLTLLSLSVLVDFTKSGANEKRASNKIDNEETKRAQEMNTKLKEDNDRLRHQLQIKDLEIMKKNQEMEAIESAAADCKTSHQWWKDEANRRTEWWKGREKLWGLKYLELQHRAAIQKEGMESRIQMLAEELLKQRMLAQVMEDLQLRNDILWRQLAETKQNICLPDSPTHDQVGGRCMNYATATWFRKTLTEQFLRDLPRHHEIVESLLKSYKTRQEQFESMTKEAERWNLKIEELDMSKEGAFDRAHKLLEERHPLYLSFQNWDAIKQHCQESSSEYLGAPEWDASTYTSGSHGMVLMEYIPPQHGKPGLYKIKNSHGEWGGSFGQRGYILIQDKVFRAMNVRHVLIASKIDWKEEALRLKTQIHKLTEQLSFYQATSNHIQKLETSKVMESLKMEARANIENLEKQLAEAKQNNCSPDSPVPKQHAVTSMSVAMSIWREMNQFINKDIDDWKLVELTVMSMDHFLQRRYPLLLTLKYGGGSIIEKYIDESSREYLGGLEWDVSMFRCTGRALVVTEYIPPKDSKPGLYKIKTSLGKYGSVPGQKEYILIEDKVLRGLDVTSVFVRIPKDQCADIERGGGK